MYVTLGRLEQAGWSPPREKRRAERPERRTYELTAAGRERVDEWLTDVTWPRPDLTNFHLKLTVAAAGGLADPLEVVNAQRRSWCAAARRPASGDVRARRVRKPRCCSRASCCASRPTSPGSMPASVRGKPTDERRPTAGRPLQALRARRDADPCRRLRRPRGRLGRGGGGERTQRVRQVHAPPAHGRARPADLWRGLGGRQPASIAPPNEPVPGCAASTSGFVFQDFHLMESSRPWRTSSFLPSSPGTSTASARHRQPNSWSVMNLSRP